MIYAVIAIITVAAIIAVVRGISSHGGGGSQGSSNTTECGKKPTFIEKLFTPEEKRAGNRGEAAATRIIQSVLRPDDRLFTHFKIESNGKRSEMDEIVVNRYGVFIIEVKDWNGTITGREEDSNWLQYKTTYENRTYENVRKNPIRQVNGQVYALKEYLKENGVHVRVSGYVLMLQGNSPVKSERVLNSKHEIDGAIHTAGRKLLDENTVYNIRRLLEPQKLLTNAKKISLK